MTGHGQVIFQFLMFFAVGWLSADNVGIPDIWRDIDGRQHNSK